MKKTLLSCFIMFIFSFVMLIGSTYAWWSETITVNENIIQMGKLDLKVEFATSTQSTIWYDLEEWDTTGVYETAKTVYPGQSSHRVLKISNAGTIPLAYRVVSNVDESNELREYIDFTIFSVDLNKTIWSKPLVDHTSEYVVLQPGEFHLYTVDYLVDPELGSSDGTFGEGLTFPFTFEIQAEQLGKVGLN